jgi:hypothetical protein
MVILPWLHFFLLLHRLCKPGARNLHAPVLQILQKKTPDRSGVFVDGVRITKDPVRLPHACSVSLLVVLSTKIFASLEISSRTGPRTLVEVRAVIGRNQLAPGTQDQPLRYVARAA